MTVVLRQGEVLSMSIFSVVYIIKEEYGHGLCRHRDGPYTVGKCVCEGKRY